MLPQVVKTLNESSPLIKSLTIRSTMDIEIMSRLRLPLLTTFQSTGRLEDVRVRHFLDFCRHNPMLQKVIFKSIFKFQRSAITRQRIVLIVRTLLENLPRLRHLQVDCGEMAGRYMVHRVLDEIEILGDRLEYFKMIGVFVDKPKKRMREMRAAVPGRKLFLATWKGK